MGAVDLPTGRAGRLCALALLMLVIGTAYLLVVTPVVGFYRQRAMALEQRQMLEPRLRATANAVPELRAQLAKLRQISSTRKVVLDGASDAIAAANLQSRIEGLAGSAGVAISSTEGLPPEPRGPYRRIGLHMTIGGPYEGIVRLFAAIETASPPLLIDNLQIHGTMTTRLLQARAILRAQQALQAANPADTPRIDAAFDVFGFRSSDTSPAVKQ